MSYGYVHIRPSVDPPDPPDPPELGQVGFRENSPGNGYAATGFTAPDCGGEDVEVCEVNVYYNGSEAASVRVRSVAGGFYAEGTDYVAVDQVIEFPGSLTTGGSYVTVTVTINNPLAGCPFPGDHENPAIVLQLSDAEGCEIGGGGINGRGLFASIALTANGI